MIKEIKKKIAFFIIIFILLYFLLGLLNETFIITNWSKITIDMLYMFSYIIIFIFVFEIISKKYF